MPDLERRLHALGAATEFPPTPDLVTAVRDRLGQPAQRRRTWLTPRPRRALAVLLALLLLPAAAVAAVPASRHAVLEWLGLRSVEVRTVPAPPRTSGAPTGAGPGRPVTLATARARVRFAVRTPAALGGRPRVFLAGAPPGGRVSLLYGRPRVLITQFRGSRTRTFLAKAVGPGTRVERVTVAGAPGAFLSGRPHGFIYADANGAIREERARLAGNVLVWERDGVVLRLEGRLTRARALRIARSLH